MLRYAIRWLQLGTFALFNSCDSEHENENMRIYRVMFLYLSPENSAAITYS